MCYIKYKGLQNNLQKITNVSNVEGNNRLYDSSSKPDKTAFDMKLYELDLSFYFFFDNKSSYKKQDSSNMHRHVL